MVFNFQGGTGETNQLDSNQTDELSSMKAHFVDNRIYILPGDQSNIEVESQPFFELHDINPHNWISQPSAIVLKFKNFDNIISDLPENILQSIRSLISRTIEEKYITPYINKYKNLPSDIERGIIKIVIKIDEQEDESLDLERFSRLKSAFIDKLLIVGYRQIQITLNEDIAIQGISRNFFLKGQVL